MSIDRAKFKGEVRRRASERIAARKRAEKQIAAGCAALTACLALFVVISPRLGWWKDAQDGANNIQLAGDAADGTMRDPSITSPTPQYPDEETGAIGSTTGGAPEPVEPQPDAPTTGFEHIVSVDIYPRDMAIGQNFSDTDRLSELALLFNAFNQTSRETISEFNAYLESDEGYRIIVNCRDGEMLALDWFDQYLYIEQQDRMIVLTTEENESLTALLLADAQY